MSAAYPIMSSTNPPLTPVAAPARPATALSCVAAVKDALGEAWLPRLYKTMILPLRTRSHHLDIAEKESAVEVQHTLLGVEMKIGRRRMLCPDFSTARYLAVFARIGCTDVALPYDITQISRLADELESAWQRMLLLVAHVAGERPRAFQSRVRSLLVREVREEIREAGAGALIPQFNQNTKQRRT